MEMGKRNLFLAWISLNNLRKPKLRGSFGTGNTKRQDFMNSVQNDAILHTAWKSIPDLAFPTRAFDQITNFKIESVFKIFFNWYIVHKRKWGSRRNIDGLLS
jgi:hypothetical protein